MSLDIYQKIKVIGKGSYGEVWLAKHKKDKKQYVLKKLELKNASKKERKAAEQEAKLLSKLKHPNIVSYKDSFETGNGLLYIAMGFCEGGDLYSRLKEQRGSALAERRIVEWYVQISMALQYMHERHILHRDLKTQNIFLTKSNIIKLGDLGIARVLESPSDMANTLIGTPYYMSPELFSNRPYNHKSDVWALGCCVYEMATLKHAFNAKDMNSLVYKILRGKMPNMPKMYSAELIQLIKAMLHQNPDKRPSVNRILRDPYIKRNIAEFLEGTKKSRRPSSSRNQRSDRSSNQVRPAGVDVTDNSRSAAQGKGSDKDRNRSKIVIDNDLEPLQVGPDLEPICEVEDEEEPSRRSSASRQSNGSRSDNRRPSGGPVRSSSDRDLNRPNYDRNQYKPVSRSKDNNTPTSASRSSASKPSSASRDRLAQPASKRNDRSPDARSVKSDRSANVNSRSKDSARSDRNLSPTPYKSRASPSRSPKDKSPRRYSDDTGVRKSKNSSKDKSSSSRSNSRSPPPPRQLPPAPKGHYRSGSDPVFPGKAESPTVSRRRAGSDRSSVDSPSQSEEGSVISSSRSSIGDSKPRLFRRKKKKSTPSSGEEPDPIAISCDSMDRKSKKPVVDYINNAVSNHGDGRYGNSYNRDSGIGLKEPENYVSEAFVHRPKLVPLKKVESEPVISAYREDRSSYQDNKSLAARPLPLLPPPHPSHSSATPAQSNSRESARGSARGITESGYSSSASSVHSSAGDSRPMSARARRREMKTLEETPRTNRSVDLSRKSMDAAFGGRVEDQYRSADYSKAQSHPKRLNVVAQQDQLDCTDGFEPIIEKPNLHPVARHRQPSVGDSSSSSDNEEEETARVEEKRNKKEMDNFISVLSTTLRLNDKPSPNGDEEEDDDVDDVAVEEEPKPQQATPPRLFNGATYYVKSPSQMKTPHVVIDAGTQEMDEVEDIVSSPSADPQFAYPSATGKVTIPAGRTMTTTGRLWERITVLRKDCIRGLGVEKLKRAYDILDNIGGDSVEEQLTALLGRDDFEAFAGKIWQLKFCEEAAFGLV